MLVEGKDQIRDSIQDALDKERSKMDEIHKADLQHKETQHTLNLLEQKKLLEQETKHLEDQLGHQTELKSVLDKLQRRTVDVGEIVESNIKQRSKECDKRCGTLTWPLAACGGFAILGVSRRVILA